MEETRPLLLQDQELLVRCWEGWGLWTLWRPSSEGRELGGTCSQAHEDPTRTLAKCFQVWLLPGESLVPDTLRLKNLSSGSQEPGFQSPAASRFLCEPFPSRDLSSII